MNLSILRNTVEVASVSIDDKTKFSHKFMAEKIITSSFIATSVLLIQIGDYIEWKGDRYYINQAPGYKKHSNFKYEYTINFESVAYSLYNKLFMDEGSADFSYHGTAEDLINLLLTNINSVDTGWTIASIEATESKTLSFSGQNCRNALNTITKEFELEWKLDSKAFTLAKTVGVATTLQFEYGRSKGLYSLTRNTMSDANIVTRVFGFGAAKNLKYDYRGGKKRLVFDDLKLETNIGLYGVREGVFTDDSIFPKRTGVVSAIDAGNIFKVIDTSLDFNINDQLLEGVVAKIVFKTGALSGYEFEIVSYNDATKEITFKEFLEGDDYKLPNDLNKATIGDEYSLVDIEMPQSYIDTAEAKLETKTQEFLDENSVPRVTYSLDIDEKFIRDNAISINVADTVNLKDTALGIDKDIRVSQISYPLVNTDNITVIIANFIPYTVEERIIKNTVENNVLTKNVNRTAIERNRRAVNRTKQLQGLVYDVDGYFDMDNIKPLSVETAMLSVGAKSQDFGLLDVRIETNAGGNENSLSISAGQLVHNQISIEGLGYIWNLPAVTFNTLIPGNVYYVFAKCSKTSLTGTWYISTDQKKVEDVAGYYLFQLGVLYDVLEDRRDFDFTKGVTYIVGDTIKTGTISSTDGLTFISLSENKIHFGDATDYLDWNNIEAGKLLVSNAKIDNAEITNATITDAVIDDAYIGDWILSDGKLKSQAGGVNPTIELDSVTGQIRVRDVSGGVSLINGDGILSNAGNQTAISLSTGIIGKASVVGLGFGNVNGAGNFLAGVYGSVSNIGSAPSYGGYFWDLMARGLNMSVNSITGTASSHTIARSTVVTACYNTAGTTVSLPLSPLAGQTHYIKKMNSSGVTIHGNGKSLYRTSVLTTQSIPDRDCFICIFDGAYWILMRTN